MENEDDVDDKDLEALLADDGDDFMSEEERQAKAARERRLARKRRLEVAESKTAATETDQGATNNNNNNLPPKRILKLDKNQQDDPKIWTKNNNNDDLKKNQDNLNDNEEENSKRDDSDDDDDFDMFSSSSVSPSKIEKAAAASNTANKTQQQQNNKNVDQQQEWDDAEGYYKASIGELINLDLPKSSANIQFRVSGVIGKGVFSTVLKCVTESNLASIHLPPQVAMKCIRHNETMAKAAHNEIRFLQRCCQKANPGIVTLLLPTDNVPLEFRGHTVLVFPYMEYNLRDVLAKFGKGVGLSLIAVRSYFGQMLAAATHMEKHKIIHSDLKPDNILVSQDFSRACICDFGSAVDGAESSEMVTPYLVSRFYRAPEIILGLIPTYAIDLWSLAVTGAELFLGRVLFQGASNNDMLYVMMQHLGPISNRLIRQHLVQAKKFPIPVHFTQDVPPQFQRLSVDTVMPHKEVYKTVSLQDFSSTLQAKFLKARSAKDSRVLVLQFSDLMHKCLTFDPTRRIAVKEALHHQFFKEKQTQSKAS